MFNIKLTYLKMVVPNVIPDFVSSRSIQNIQKTRQV